MARFFNRLKKAASLAVFAKGFIANGIIFKGRYWKNHKRRISFDILMQKDAHATWCISGVY